MVDNLSRLRDIVTSRSATSDVHCFTSFSFSYLDRARVLARSVRKHNPDWTMWALIVDQPPEDFDFDIDEEDFDYVWFAEQLDLDDFQKWIFRHNVIEACTAVKGPFAHRLVQAGAKKIVYLDPDVAVFSSLQPLEKLLDEHDILLTPHQLAPDNTKTAIIDNEICSLKHGSYNLGFFALRGDRDGARFAAWWSERLIEFCRDDIPNGLFTDQKWCDLVPCFFGGTHVLRDPGYNVASWNLSQREIEINAKGEILVNGSPLRFFHFTKLGPVGDTMTTRYAVDNAEVFELWSWYADQVESFRDASIPVRWWHYGTFEDGTAVRPEQRILYGARIDLQVNYPEPFAAGRESFLSWYEAHQSPEKKPRLASK